MKKWEKPELKVLGVENTYEGISFFNVPAGEGKVWICENCKGHQRNDISDNNHAQVGDDWTSDTTCHCGSNRWIKVTNGNYECNPGTTVPMS